MVVDAGYRGKYAGHLSACAPHLPGSHIMEHLANSNLIGGRFSFVALPGSLAGAVVEAWLCEAASGGIQRWENPSRRSSNQTRVRSSASG